MSPRQHPKPTGPGGPGTGGPGGASPTGTGREENTTSASPSASRWSGSLELLRLMLRPSRPDPAGLYRLLSKENVLAEGSLWLNLGYWEKAQSYETACEALARELGSAVGMGRSDETRSEIRVAP